LARLLGADRIISLSHDIEAEDKCREAFETDDVFDNVYAVFDLCIITMEDSSLSEDFCDQFSHKVVKTCNNRRLASDTYGLFRRWIFSYWRSLSSPYHFLDVKPLDHLVQLVEDGKLQPVLDSAYAFEQAEEAFQATASAATVGKTIITFGLRGHREVTNNSSVK
jgi:NADPH:quinone reductase-like Zn-dependent oxidoreductase